ncbi:MAG: Phosphoglucomutase [Chlamydiia bacterium]|nr:Phosphoglucomutase [Chlamydiia bacterium]MCH9624036.1 Phosphoglucomutase [Chlamydiia bacterium]
MGDKSVKKSTEETIKQWLKAPYDEKTRQEVKELITNHKEEVDEAFGGIISFGTGGMREKMGPGPGRMNKYTIRLATAGVATHILKHPKELWKKGVVICHDCRNHSREFAMQTARVFAGYNIPVHITKDLRPTPFCSFAIRHLGAISGVNITASHNPKEYNGYKVYWNDGGQVVTPHDTGIINEIHNIKDISLIPLADQDSPLIKIIDTSVEKAYLETVYDESIYKQENEAHGKKMKICYSPLHGAGITMIPQALELWGFEDVELVKSQEKPDGNFPTTKTPNPETESGRAEGIKTLKQSGGDLLLISDPDSDRLSVSIQKDKSIYTFSGNEIGIIFLHFLATHKERKSDFGSVTTIVSTPLCKVITEALGGKCIEVLTGFKYIAELVKEWEDSGPDFLLGFEESLGYLSSKNVRDKDAVLASCQIAEIALYLKLKGKTLLDYLFDIYQEYGIYREGGISVELAEKAMLDAAIAPILDHPPKELLGQKVVRSENYISKMSTDMITGKTSIINLPSSKVCALHLEDGSRYIFRPSGTEPKIKIYASLHQKTSEKVTIEEVQKLDAHIEKNLACLKETLINEQF